MQSGEVVRGIGTAEKMKLHLNHVVFYFLSYMKLISYLNCENLQYAFLDCFI